MPEKRSDDTRNGLWGRICSVDLNSRSVRFEDLDRSVGRKYLSGVGIGAKVLWDRLKPGVDPLGPDNILGFTTGLLTDTGSLFSGRFTVVGKSPASGGWGDANCGGFFSPYLKRCEIDALFFSGTSDTPVYLHIDHEKAEIKDASDLWGKDTLETEDALKARYGKSAQVACIGPAGEKLSLIAGIATDFGRMAARGGLGAVMGSKKLKAVVACGKSRISVADRKRMKEITGEFRKKIKFMDSGQKLLSDRVGRVLGWITGKGFFMRQPALIWRWMLKKYGTPGLTALLMECGDMPVKNWTGTVRRDFPYSRYRKISGDRFLRFEKKKYHCYSCPLGCGGEIEIQGGPYEIGKMHKPEYETIASFGTMLLNDDIYSICKMNDVVNRGGMDSISCGNVLAFAVECFEEGIIDASDTGGLELGWGKSDALVKLTEMIVNRQGVGDLLADGVKTAAERIGKGSEKFAVHCGGVEAPMHDPKFDPSFGITYSCEPTPGRHTISSSQYLDLQFLEKKFSRAKAPPAFTMKRGRYSYGPQGEGNALGSYFKMLADCAGVCLFGTQIGGDFPLCDWMNAATGWSLSNDEYLVIGERIQQLRHAFNVREGINPIKDYKPHGRVFGDPPLQTGPLKDVTLDVDTLARSFYAANQWDTETARPARQRLKDLELDDVADTLYGDTEVDES